MLEISLSKELRTLSKEMRVPYDVLYCFQRLLMHQLTLGRNLGEKLRILKSTKGYGIYNTFKLIDSGSRSYFGEEDVQLFMTKQGKYLSTDERKGIIRMFDKNGDGKISLSDYVSTIIEFDLATSFEAHKEKQGIEETNTYQTPKKLGKDSGDLSGTNYKTPLNRPIVATPDTSPETTKKEGQELPSLARMFKQHLEVEKVVEEAKLKLYEVPTFEFSAAFRFFDQDNYDRLSLCELKGGLDKLGVASTTRDLHILLRRYDLNEDGVLSQYEFEKMLHPMQSGQNNLIRGRRVGLVCVLRVSIVVS